MERKTIMTRLAGIGSHRAVTSTRFDRRGVDGTVISYMGLQRVMATATLLRRLRGGERVVVCRSRVDSTTSCSAVSSFPLQRRRYDTCATQSILVNRFYPKTSQNGEYWTRLCRHHSYGLLARRPNLRRPSRSALRFGCRPGVFVTRRQRRSLVLMRGVLIIITFLTAA